MTTTRIFAAAAVLGMVASTAVAGGYSKSGPATAEPMVQAASSPMIAPRFNWTGPYAGAAIGYGQMKLSGGGDIDNGAAALFGGYRYDTGNAVLGAELSVVPTTFGSATLPNGDEIKGGASLMLTAGLPISADARTLAYIGAGPTVVRTSGVGGSKTSTGATLGLGIDHMLTESTMLRGAVTYSAINDVSNANYKTRTLAVGVGIGFKF